MENGSTPNLPAKLIPENKLTNPIIEYDTFSIIGCKFSPSKKNSAARNIGTAIIKQINEVAIA